ncbi:ClpP/crotonase [Karstenula rhodostoma CBS 690.94]|uniref:ClpP/crotonase n=1 Tax=Karstenula rhodostoma CBS 690.94 TaxID=1392251 RepID=A0A9P4PJU4_9PLEO|nr:ClpP/crotonase [Karstenula rhodostoma CBS 690.94]
MTKAGVPLSSRKWATTRTPTTLKLTTAFDCNSDSGARVPAVQRGGCRRHLHIFKTCPFDLHILLEPRQVAMHPANKDTEVLVVSSKQEAGVAVVELNRAIKRNALSQNLINELLQSLHRLDQDVEVRAIVLTSTGQSPFCAGADIQELAKISTAEAYRIGWLKDLEEGFSKLRTPVIAAVRGYAFGGGFEIALMCDMLYASANARFGFPEIKLGTIPGAGGTQRLAKAVGKQKAMEFILTGEPVTSADMERYGIVNKAVPTEQDVVTEAIKIATRIASFSAPAIGLAKQAIKTAETTTLDAGLELERALYYSSFSLADCKEGIAAFLEKRPPGFVHE